MAFGSRVAASVVADSTARPLCLPSEEHIGECDSHPSHGQRLKIKAKLRILTMGLLYDLRPAPVSNLLGEHVGNSQGCWNRDFQDRISDGGQIIRKYDSRIGIAPKASR